MRKRSKYRPREVLRDPVRYCEVYEGGESVRECPVWQEFVHYNEIRIKK